MATWLGMIGAIILRRRTLATRPSYGWTVHSRLGSLKHLTDDDSQKFTIKMLKDMGCTKLAEHAEMTINKLREMGAPNITEDKVIRSILKEAGKQRR